MWVTQTYLHPAEPNAKVFIYYFFEDYNDSQVELTRRVQHELERMGEIHGGNVSLYMPNERYADRIESEMREMTELWQHVSGSLPGLIISNKPLSALTKRDEITYIPFHDMSAENVAKIIAEVRATTDFKLNQSSEEATQHGASRMWSRLGEAVELKPGLFGVRMDLRKLFRI